MRLERKEEKCRAIRMSLFCHFETVGSLLPCIVSTCQIEWLPAQVGLQQCSKLLIEIALLEDGGVS